MERLYKQIYIMGLFNEHSSQSDTASSSAQGPPGPQGVGYKVDAQGNYDIQNKKLTNVKNGDMDNDVMVKSQIEGYVNTNFVAKSGDTMLGQLVVPKDDYPVQGNLNKVISYEAQREIFLSKKEGGKMEQAIDMNGFSIDNLQLPKNSDNACSKLYVDNNFLNRLTGGEVGGDLDMRGHSIKYLKLDKSDSAAARVAELNLKADKSYVDSEISNIDLSGHITAWVAGLDLKADKSALNNYLKLDGSRAMTGNLNINNHIITNVKSPLNDSDAVNKGHLDNHSIQSAHPQKNTLDYIMNDVDQTSSEYGIEIDKIDDFNDSFHSYNKKVIYLKLLKDGNNYRARIGYNIFKLLYYLTCNNVII